MGEAPLLGLFGFRLGDLNRMKNEFVLAFNEMLDEKQLPRETVIKALESAMVSAYRKAVTASTAQHIEAKLDPDTGNFKIYAEKEVVDNVLDDRTEVVLAEARKVNPDAQIGDMVVVETTPKDFGRIAAQTARQVIQQRLRDAERQDQIEYYEKKVGEIVSGVVQSISNEGYTIGLDRKAEGLLLRKDTIKGEHFRLHQHVRALIVEVKDTSRSAQIMLSRTDRKFLFRLLEIDVPEIYHGIVEVRSIAREPGMRAKIAVSATQQGIDPVGACVGMQGKRIQPIVKELHDEKIDVIEWNPDPAVFIAKAISPAKVVGVYLGNNKNATVVVPEDQLSLAIGRDGQNARLAAKLTNWRIDIKSVIESASEILGAIDSKKDIVEENQESGERTVIINYADLFEQEKDNIEAIRAILAKRAENRPISPDETETLNRFVDRIERQKVAGYNLSMVSEVIEKLSKQNLTEETLFAMPVSASGLPKYVTNILYAGGFRTFGDLYNHMMSNPEEIYKLQGVTPRIMSDIASLVKFLGSIGSKKTETEPVEVSEEQPTMEAQPVAEIAEAEELPEPVSFEKSDRKYEGKAEDFVDLTQLPLQTETKPAEPEPQTEYEDISFDELFNAMRNEIATPTEYLEDEDELKDDLTSTKGKKKKKKKNVEIEYDPDSDSTLIHKKHKRGEDEDWGW